jgi:hypothetical protein
LTAPAGPSLVASSPTQILREAKFGNGVTTFPISRLTIPGANLGVTLFGNNLFGQACDFFNPLTDIQDLIDLIQPDDGGVRDEE